MELQTVFITVNSLQEIE